MILLIRIVQGGMKVANQAVTETQGRIRPLMMKVTTEAGVVGSRSPEDRLISKLAISTERAVSRRSTI